MLRLQVLGSMLLVLAISPLAAEPADLSLSGIADEGAGRRLPRHAIDEGPAGALAVAAGVDSFPVPCATPLLQPPADRTARPGRPAAGAWQQARAFLSSPPQISGAQRVTTADGSFAIHFAARGRPGAPRHAPHQSGDLLWFPHELHVERGNSVEHVVHLTVRTGGIADGPANP